MHAASTVWTFYFPLFGAPLSWKTLGYRKVERPNAWGYPKWNVSKSTRSRVQSLLHNELMGLDFRTFGLFVCSTRGLWEFLGFGVADLMRTHCHHY